MIWTRAVYPLAVLCLLPPVPGRAQTGARDAQPPAANRVEPFSGAVGRKFTVATTAEPGELRVGDTLRLTIRVVAEGPWQRPPQRPDLRRHEKYASFPRSFHVENGADRHDADGQAWEFDYRLRPLQEDVKEVPRLPFVYYKPGQGYQTTSAPAVKLRVRAREEVRPADVQGTAEPVRHPERLYEIVEGPAVLRRDDPSPLPGQFLAVILLATPPALGASWYVVWRLRNPEAARRARLRRSRAAQRALHALGRVGHSMPDEQAERVTAVVAEYLRQRFELPAAEPTPAEVAEHLARVGVPHEAVRRLEGFLRAGDAVRFAAAPAGEAAEWVRDAGDLILTLEAVPCPSPAS